MIKNTFNEFGVISKFLHWLIGLLMIGMLIYGYFLEDFPKDLQPLTYNLHKLIGLTIFLLVLIRLAWRAVNIIPVLPQDVPFWQRRAERLVQHLMYFFMIVMPLAGWIGSAAAGRNPHLGEYTFALPIEKNKAVVDVSFWFHNNIALVLIALISVHVLAALYHYFIKRDNILQRML